MPSRSGTADTPSLEDEAALIQRAKTDPQAFGLLYERYVGRIYSYIYYRSGNRADAEDLTAKTFYRAMRHMSRYTDRGLPFSAWLYRIAHNLVANWHRDKGRRHVISLDQLHSTGGQDPSPEHLAEKNHEARHLLKVIGRLPPERQQLLILKFAEQLSNAEIGAVMGRTEGAIKSLYHRTLLSLRESLVDTESGEEL